MVAAFAGSRGLAVYAVSQRCAKTEYCMRPALG